MFSVLNRRPRGVRPAPRARLALEALDYRDQPTGVTPVIHDFAAVELSNGFFMISGKVADDHPGGLTVTFGGGMTGIDEQHATTASDGSFSFSVFVGQSGMVTATVTDDDGNVSPEVEEDIHPTRAPGDWQSGGGGQGG